MIQANVQESEWNDFIAVHSGSFLQSYEWAEFQKACGRRVYLLNQADYKAVLIRHSLPLRQNYLYIPRGPVMKENTQAAREEFVKAVKALARKEKSIFVRMDPPFLGGSAPTKQDGLYDIGRSIQPRKNLIIDLTQSEEKLSANMHEKTRYNIRVAQRHNVMIRQTGRESMKRDSELFWDLIRKTTERQNIRSHDKKYYDRMIEFFCSKSAGDGSVFGRLYLAYFGEKPLAAIFIIFFGTRATYLHGGTSLEHKNVMAPYLLHWEVMRQAKAEGFTEYDFGGIDEKRWSGITRFKTGFGGNIEKYSNAFDLPTSKPKYYVYNLIRKII